MDGTYLFGATLLHKIIASAKARIRGRLVLTGATEIRGSLGEISANHVSLATAIWLQTIVPLTAGDAGALPSSCRGASGLQTVTSPPTTHPSGAPRLAERRREGSMTPPRSDGYVRMPDAEFDAILTRAAEEGAKRALHIRDLCSLVECDAKTDARKIRVSSVDSIASALIVSRTYGDNPAHLV